MVLALTYKFLDILIPKNSRDSIATLGYMNTPYASLHPVEKFIHIRFVFYCKY